MGLVAPRHVGSPWTRARTRVPCIGRRILNPCTTREVPFPIISELLLVRILGLLDYRIGILIFLFVHLHLPFFGLLFLFSRRFSFFFFFLIFIYLFIYGCIGSSFLCEGFLLLRQVGATFHHGARASHYRGLSCGAQAPDAQAQ